MRSKVAPRRGEISEWFVYSPRVPEHYPIAAPRGSAQQVEYMLWVESAATALNPESRRQKETADQATAKKGAWCGWGELVPRAVNRLLFRDSLDTKRRLAPSDVLQTDRRES